MDTTTVKRPLAERKPSKANSSQAKKNLAKKDSHKAKSPHKAAINKAPAHNVKDSGAPVLHLEANAAKPWRLFLIMFLLLLIAAAVIYKMASLYTTEQSFLQAQGNSRAIRTVEVAGRRGLILDREGVPLSVGAPIFAVWVDPKIFDHDDETKVKRLADTVGLHPKELGAKLKRFKNKRFMYVKREVTPSIAGSVKGLKLKGVGVTKGFRRYYPAGEVVAHLIGFTSREGKGQEGMELAYQPILKATNGLHIVQKDLLGRTVKHIKQLEEVQHGQDITLSIDMRAQYNVYKELKAAVTAHNADSGSVVVLDVLTGETVALANYPSYNPNNRKKLNPTNMKNRAMVDVFEPGSTMKPLTIAAALASGEYRKDDVIDTAPGYMKVDRFTIRDHRNYKELDMKGIIVKSSNVGVAKITMSLPHNTVSNIMRNVGIGEVLETVFPGTATGILPWLYKGQYVEKVTQSYGYGLNMTLMHLAQSYVPLANDGYFIPVTLIKRDKKDNPVKKTRVLPESVARDVRDMMVDVVSVKGTARQAAIPGYRVAGKTGTVHKVGQNGYEDSAYRSLFVGMVPASNPRYVIAVMVDHPKGQEYYGGEVAAPIFARAGLSILRLNNIVPDIPDNKKQTDQ